MRPYLLLLRFVVVNIAAFAVLVTVWIQGWVDVVLEGDVTRLTLVIASVFLAGFIIAAAKVWRCSLELNAVHADDDSRPTRCARTRASICGSGCPTSPSRAITCCRGTGRWRNSFRTPCARPTATTRRSACATPSSRRWNCAMRRASTPCRSRSCPTSRTHRRSITTTRACRSDSADIAGPCACKAFSIARARASVPRLGMDASQPRGS